MNTREIFQYIADVKTPWSLSAFAIATLLAIYEAFLKKPHAAARSTLWVPVAAIAALGLVPIVTNAYLQRAKIRIESIYRVRVTAVDERDVPVAGVVVRVTAANEAKTTTDGSAELAVPRASMPLDGKVTIFADKEQAFLHGHTELLLGEDTNPSVVILVGSERSAPVKGAVQDEAGHGLKGARVSISGDAAVETDADGSFRIPNAGSPGQKVLLHGEKSGYKPVSQYHPAGPDPAILTLPRTR